MPPPEKSPEAATITFDVLSICENESEGIGGAAASTAEDTAKKKYMANMDNRVFFIVG